MLRLTMISCLAPLICFGDLKQDLMDKIDETSIQMIRYITDDNYMDDVYWNYLAGKNDAYHEILYVLMRDQSAV